ncbi:MAG: histidine--tRNA ligase family protein [Dehalococcoidia bacterium]|nr:histidine--tRNA ligase family protein [Dehalococcoidia bacterium]
MPSSQILSLPGMADVTGGSFERSAKIVDALAGYYVSRGYAPIDTPIVEDAELFVRKSGGELSGMLYTFDDPGGNRVSLRPEFTPSVIRHYIEHASDFGAPTRLSYSGPVFRYHSLDDGDLRQFTQVGTELIGLAGSDADAEILSIACGGLGELGLSEWTVRIGDTGLLNRVLDAHGLSDATKGFVFAHLDELKAASTSVDRLVALAGEMGLIRAQGEDDLAPVATENGEEATRRFVRDMLSDSVSSPVGRRTTDQIVERLLRKLRRADSPDRLASALALVADLSKVSGAPDETLPTVEEILRAHDTDPAFIDGLRALFDVLPGRRAPLSNVVLDLAFVPGIAYYTGIVFEISCDGDDGSVTVGGGGRYDGLVRALGGEDVPAMGFALRVDKLVAALARRTE